VTLQIGGPPGNVAGHRRGLERGWAARHEPVGFIHGRQKTLARSLEERHQPGEPGLREGRPHAGIARAEHVRPYAGSAYHPVGTCRMGADPASVVDPGLRVRGVDGLRVADASVVPFCVAGNAQASVIAVAEKASDLILG